MVLITGISYSLGFACSLCSLLVALWDYALLLLYHSDRLVVSKASAISIHFHVPLSFLFTLRSL